MRVRSSLIWFRFWELKLSKLLLRAHRTNRLVILEFNLALRTNRLVILGYNLARKTNRLVILGYNLVRRTNRLVILGYILALRTNSFVILGYNLGYTYSRVASGTQDQYIIIIIIKIYSHTKI